MTRREDLAYLAGLIDGEGTITISRHQSRTAGQTTGRWCYQVKLLLVNTDLRLIQRCHEITGCGLVYQSTADKRGTIPANWNPVHRYQAVALKARAIIQDVRPYLIAKAAHADLVLAMPTRTKNIYDRSLVPAQEAAFLAMRELNRRGRKAVGVS